MKRVLWGLILFTGAAPSLLCAQQAATKQPPAKHAPAAQTPAAQSPEPAPPAADESAAIRATVDSYVAAFNKGDAEALAAHWGPDAVYTNRLTGEVTVGRPAIAAQFTELFKSAQKPKLAVEVESVSLLSPSVGVERGRAKFLFPDQEPEELAYTAVHVKRDGRWQLDRVDDGDEDLASALPPPSNYEHLKALEWMVGEWIDEDENVRVVTECSWTKNRNFLKRSYSMTSVAGAEMAGMQIIGWDPSAKKIRSWTFDSNGTFAQAEWSFKKDRWHVSNLGVLPDGRKATAVNVIKPRDADSFTWQTIERTVGGELQPNIAEVLIVRSPSQP